MRVSVKSADNCRFCGYNRQRFLLEGQLESPFCENQGAASLR